MKPKVVSKRNLKHGGIPVWGTAKYSRNPIIEIDKTLKGLPHLTILTHEALHLCYPEMGEAEIRRSAKVLASVLWGQGYRRIER